MNLRISVLAMLFMVLCAAMDVRAASTEFTYQGQLRSAGVVVSGSHDFQFTLFDADTAGNAVGSAVAVNAVTVTNGLFTAPLDFGNSFTGPDRWLEIAVRPAGGASFTTLTPRQKITATPYALALPGLYTQNTAGTPNIVGGVAQNTVTATVTGATISGGGTAALTNAVTDDFGTVGGGRGNRAGNNAGTTTDSIGATVSGGESNVASGLYATVVGGQSNTASGTFSIAMGRRAKAVNNGSVVIADSTSADFTSTADDQVSIRAANGVLIANDAGNAATVPVGTRFRDNSVVAWGRVTANGTLDTNFNVASITKVGTGHYKVNLNAPVQSGFSLIPVVTPEVDEAAGNVPPTGAANVRFAVTNQFAAGTNFDVYMYNGSFNSVDNDFQFMVTGR